MKPIKIFLLSPPSLSHAVSHSVLFYLAPCISMSMHGNKYVFIYAPYDTFIFMFILCALRFFLSLHFPIWERKVQNMKKCQINLCGTRFVLCACDDFYHIPNIMPYIIRAAYFLFSLFFKLLLLILLPLFDVIEKSYCGTLPKIFNSQFRSQYVITFREHIDKFLFITSCKF